MSLAEASLWISSLWLVVYAAKYALRRPKSLLPLSQHRRLITEVTVEHLNIRLKTEAFNVFHDRLSSWLSATNKSPLCRQTLLRLYDLGSFVSIIGMLLGYCLLFITAVTLSADVLRARPDSHHNVSIVTKRGLEYAGDTITSPSSTLRISPIIPGLTVPISHLPLILVALAISQIVHEAGHAIAAALHRVPMLSCGVGLNFLLPSAFVVLPTARLEKLSPRDRLQIVSGGCFHNITFLCLLLVVAWSGVGSLLARILFQDVSALGRLVISVDYDSPLAAHLPVGALIVKVDDSSMAFTSSEDPWGGYLLSPSLNSMRGWCTDDSLLIRAIDTECTNNAPYSCFVSLKDKTLQYGLDPVDVFTNNLPRCTSSVECSSLSSCVAPRRDQQLTRISTSRINNVEDIIVWKGSREEIWDQVQVGDWRPRIPFVSYKLPILASTFFEYMKMANVSLYLINTLPILALDGYQLLATLLQLFFHPAGGAQSVDPEVLNVITRPSRQRNVQRACVTFLSFLAILLVTLCGFLGIIDWARQ